jgi:predicted amino acid dehydrogenase
MVKLHIHVSDIIAVLIIAGGIVLKSLGIDTVVDSLLVAVASFYFGSALRRKK